MTPIADMIEKMAADGVPMATILLAVRTAERVAANGNSGGIPVDAAAEKRRAYDRERKRTKPNSTGVSTGIPPEQSIALTSLDTTDPQKVTEKKEKKEEASRRKTGCVLPDDWHPSEGHYVEAETEHHRSHSDVDKLAKEMRIWSKTNAHRAVARKSDWDLTFTGWMCREWKNGASNGQRPHHARRQSGADDFFAGLATVAADIDGHRDVAGQPDDDPPFRGKTIEH